METNEPISSGEAAAALAEAKRARTSVAWRGYPAWYWLGTGAALGLLSYALLLPGWWVMPVAVATAAALVIVSRAASRARGVRERCARSAMTVRDQVILGGPAALLILAGSAAAKFASWPPVVAAVLVFVVFAGTGLALSARAARP
jgi:hypothetical protein